MARAIGLMRLAVEREANLAYDEPPPWHYPSRHCLGALELLAAVAPSDLSDNQARVAAARRAEKVYLADLNVWPGNAWSAIGLAKARQEQPDEYSQDQIAALWERAHKSWGDTERFMATTSCPAFGRVE